METYFWRKVSKQILHWSSVENDSRFLDLAWYLLNSIYIEYKKQLEKILAIYFFGPSSTTFKIVICIEQTWLKCAYLFEISISSRGHTKCHCLAVTISNGSRYTLAIQDFLGGKSGWVTS